MTPTRDQVSEVVRRALIEDAGMPAAWFPTEGSFVGDAVTDAVMALLADTAPEAPKSLAYGRFAQRRTPDVGPEYVMVRVYEGQGNLHIDGEYAIYRRTEGPAPVVAGEPESTPAAERHDDARCRTWHGPAGSHPDVEPHPEPCPCSCHPRAADTQEAP